MAIEYGFFHSVGGDRKYNADDISNYFDGLVSNGVFESVGDRLAVTAGEGLTVNVGTGRALIDCRWLKNDATYTISLSPADVQLSRYDAIVVKLDLTARTMSIEVIEGSPSTLPLVPMVQNTETVKYLTLARVRVNAGVTTISASQITDQRGSTACPWVTGIVKQVDTADLFLQYQTAYSEMMEQTEEWQAARQAEFESWYTTLTDTLTVSTSLHKYEFSFETQSEGILIPLIEQYEEGDVLMVHLNGVMLIEGTEYTASPSTGWLILSKSIPAENTVTQILIKSAIG